MFLTPAVLWVTEQANMASGQFDVSRVAQFQAAAAILYISAQGAAVFHMEITRTHTHTHVVKPFTLYQNYQLNLNPSSLYLLLFLMYGSLCCSDSIYYDSFWCSYHKLTISTLYLSHWCCYFYVGRTNTAIDPPVFFILPSPLPDFRLS